jgi:hypothetical protein
VGALSAGEPGHDQAGGLRADCGDSPSALLEMFLRLISRQVPGDHLSDHAPINYTSAVWGLR